jgi:hypothetical protein
LLIGFDQLAESGMMGSAKANKDRSNKEYFGEMVNWRHESMFFWITVIVMGIFSDKVNES